ncbi:winged helix DNA-binding domain-containing protein [Micromonospora acroterricola]|uniref:Winged helix DNA-binding domain-containing protein n=1 Tax=Micromonospora acroterricola TaxID=2202421 RepID=A0A317CX74_9ACTN|nr:winged helix DNA-binding domain-containing protein [Micromonospora acroterricola]PWR06734.1 winged helix DNA-binding domain-containing protein [Micromonospora acroterricola]
MPVEFTAAEALALRMTSLLLRPHPTARPGTVAEVVEWFGAMQAQDLASGLWSLGARLPGRTVADVQAALERREALRTWPMRGTVHLVPPADARWMLELTGVRSLAGAATRRAQLGLTDTDADRAVDVLGAALAGGGRLTRAQCLAALRAAGLGTDGQRGYHLLWYASVRGVTCLAPNVGTEQTFALLDEWAPGPRRLDRDEALALLAHRYVRGHGPVTAREFAGWTGLTLTDARRGLAAAGDALSAVGVDGEPMHVDAALLDAPRTPVDDVLVLPGFDEYLLGYRDRTLMLDPAHQAAVVPGNNGIFQATVVRAGRVVGVWKRRAGRAAVTVTIQPLAPLGATERARVERALSRYADYLGLPPRFEWPA